MTINLTDLFYLILIVIVSLSLLIQGLRMVFRKENLLLPFERFSIFLLKIMAGEEKARIREAELLSPNRMRRMGPVILFSGLIGIIGGIAGIVLIFLPLVRGN